MIYQQQNPIPRRSIPASMMYQQRNLVAEPSMPVPMMHQQRNLVAEPSMPVPMMHPQTMVAGPSMPVSMMPQKLNMVPGSSMPVCADSLQGVNNPSLHSVYTSYIDLEGTDTVDLGYNPLQNPVYTSMDLDDSHTVDLEKHPSGIVPTIQNIVSTVNLGCKLNLKKIALNARNAEYNPNRFAAVIMRIRQPKTTALIFATGKMVCTGAKSEDQSKIAARKFARIVQKIGFPAEFKDFKIQNIVASCDVKFIVSLEMLASSHGFFSRYEPELFPGLIYDMKQPKIVLLIFVSGKVVLTGGKVREEIYEAFENIYPVLESYRKILKG